MSEVGKGRDPRGYRERKLDQRQVAHIGRLLLDLEERSQDVSVQESRCMKLMEVVGNAQYLSTVVEQGGVEAVIRAMRLHAENAAIQVAGCTTLMHLSWDQTAYTSKIRAEGGIPAVIRGMRALETNADVQRAGCGALRNLASGNAANTSEIGENGGVEAVIGAMAAHSNNIELQEDACKALVNLAAADAATRSMIAVHGGIEVVIQAMRHDKFESGFQPGLHATACGVLRFLAAGHVATRTAIAEKGGIEALIRTMKLCELDHHVQVAGCGAFANLASEDAGQTSVLGQQGDVIKAALLRAMKAHTMNADVQKDACKALLSLLDLNSRYDPEIEPEIVKAVILAMKVHKRSAGVQKAGCGVLRTSARKASNWSQMGDSEVIQAVVDALNRHAENAFVSEAAWSALKELVDIGATVAPHAKESELIELAHTTIRAHRDKPEVRAAADAAVSSLKRGHEDDLVHDQGCASVQEQEDDRLHLDDIRQIVTQLKGAAEAPEEQHGSTSVSSASTVSMPGLRTVGRLQWLRSAVTTLPDEHVQTLDDCEPLGVGGQASIERGLYRGVPVAIKIYTVTKRSEEAKEDRALTEALLMQKMSSTSEGARRIVRCHGVHIEEEKRTKHVHLVLELAPFGSLDNILHKEAAPHFWKPDMGEWSSVRRRYIESRQLQWLLGVAEGLCFLHELRLLHCDVKTGNVLLFHDGRTPKLADFGSCLLARGQRWQGSVTVATMHGVGFTPRYQAPERADDSTNLSAAADVWSFAILAFEVLFGTRAWASVDDSQARQLHQYKLEMRTQSMVPNQLTVRDPRLAQPALVAVMEACWSVLPTNRPSMESVAREMRLAVAEESKTTQEPDPGHKRQEPEPGVPGPVLKRQKIKPSGMTGDDAEVQQSQKHLVVTAEFVLSDSKSLCAAATVPAGCRVGFPPLWATSLSSLSVEKCSLTSAMIGAAALGINRLSDGTLGNVVFAGPAVDYQPSGMRFMPPIKLRLPVWLDFLRQLENEGIVFRLGVFTWDEVGGIWWEVPGRCKLVGSEVEVEAESFCLKFVGAVLECIQGAYTSLWRTPVKFVAVAPALERLPPRQEFIFSVHALEVRQSYPDDLSRALRGGTKREVGSSEVNVAQVVMPPCASVEVFASAQPAVTAEQPFANVPYSGQCFLRNTSGDGGLNITGKVVVNFETDVDPPSPHHLLFDIPRRARQEPEHDVRQAEIPERQAVAPGQVEPRVVQLVPQTRSKPRIYAFFSTCPGDAINSGTQLESTQQTRMVHSAVEMSYESSTFQVSTFDLFHEQMMLASVRNTEIIHFAGHGGHQGGLKWVQAQDGAAMEDVSACRIAEVIGRQSILTGGTVKCVFLNACDTEALGNEIVGSGVPFVLCWRGSVPDPAAMACAKWFYKQLLSAQCDGTKFESAYQAARTEVERWREQQPQRLHKGKEQREEERGDWVGGRGEGKHCEGETTDFGEASDQAISSDDRGRVGVEKLAGSTWELLFLTVIDRGENASGRECTESSSSLAETGVGGMSKTNQIGEAELRAFEALGVELLYPQHMKPPCRLRDTIQKYWEGSLKAESLWFYGLEETQYHHCISKGPGKTSKRLRLTVDVLNAWFQPVQLGCRPISEYEDVFAPDGALLHLARAATMEARGKTLHTLAEALQLHDCDLRMQTSRKDFDSSHCIAMAIKDCWERLKVLQADTSTEK